jgi:hypothetical protein
MITFLEYTCERYMGPPVYGRSWNCLFHEDLTPSLVVRPPKQRPDGTWYPVKYKCFSCGAWGDEVDLIRHFYPDDTKLQFVKRWQSLCDGYQHLTGKQPPSTYSLSGRRGQKRDEIKLCMSELRAVLRERSTKWSREDVGLYSLVWAHRIASDNGVKPEELVRHVASELIELKATGGQKHA